MFMCQVILYQDDGKDGPILRSYLNKVLQLVHAESQFCHCWFVHVPHLVILHQLHQHCKCFFFRHLQHNNCKEVWDPPHLFYCL